MKPTAVFTFLIMALCCVSTSHATTFTNSVVLDLGTADITNGSGGGQLIYAVGASLVPITPIVPQVGDTLITTISFLNGDRLKIVDGPNSTSPPGPAYTEGLYFYLTGPSLSVGNHTATTTGVVFSNLLGSLTDSTPGGFQTGFLAQRLGRSDFTDSEISFDGLILTTTIDSLPGGGTDTYTQFGLGAGRAGGFEVISNNTVPEPTSSALALAATLFLIGRRRAR